MPNKEKKFFSTDDFNFGQPYAEMTVLDEYHDEVKERYNLEYGNWNPGMRKNKDFHGVKMSARFKDEENDSLLTSLLHLDPQAGEHISDIYVSWYGDEKFPPYIFASVFDNDLCERECSIPMEEGSSAKLMDKINYEINKTDLDRFREHLDEIGEEWSYTDDSKTGIECSYLNGGKSYQVYAVADDPVADDYYHLHFVDADTFMFGKDTYSKPFTIEDVKEQEELLNTVVATLQTDDGKTLSVHKLRSHDMLVSENGKNLQICDFESIDNCNCVIGFEDGDNEYVAKFKRYLNLDDYYQSVIYFEPLNFHITQDNNTELNRCADVPVFTQYHQSYDLRRAREYEDKDISFKVYEIDERKYALIGGSWYGIPMKPEWVKPEEIPDSEESDIGYDMFGGGFAFIKQKDILNTLDPKKEQVAGMYRFDEDSTFIVHTYGQSENGCKTALISDQKDGQVMSAKWCKSDIPIKGANKGKFYFEKNGKIFLIPSEKIRPYRETFNKKLKGFQKAVAECDVFTHSFKEQCETKQITH